MPFVSGRATIAGVLVVLNRVKDEAMERYMQRKLAEHGLEPIGIIHEDVTLARCWLEGSRLESTSTEADIAAIVEELEAVAIRQAVAV